MSTNLIPVIDLFAGPGGLSEGFATARNARGERIFEIVASFEKDPLACATLKFRSAFRANKNSEFKELLYSVMRNELSLNEAFALSNRFASAYKKASAHIHEIELGPDTHKLVNSHIRNALKGREDWILIGGPPCQAYSIAGRSRMRPVDPEKFEQDSRHSLYIEYLRILAKFRPSIFVMENVKGILTSKLNGESTFQKILNDLENAFGKNSYTIRSLVSDKEQPEMNEFIVRSENYGIPQKRHRVILLGIRRDLHSDALSRGINPQELTLDECADFTSISSVLKDLPKIRSGLSSYRGCRRDGGGHDEWLAALRRSTQGLVTWRSPIRTSLREQMLGAIVGATLVTQTGGPFVKWGRNSTMRSKGKLVRDWYNDENLSGVTNHESRLHMETDLHRYLFVSCFTKLQGFSPKLTDFPGRMLPDHQNIKSDGETPFADRFRAHIASAPANTITSHLSKDGHANIHFDPAQCRGLTVREAARIQTFPDNYYFMGSRTEQYKQVGNAVPPLLAKHIAQTIARFLSKGKRIRRLI